MDCLEGSGVPVLYIGRAQFIKVNCEVVDKFADYDHLECRMQD
jgi:hypothetical protein